MFIQVNETGIRKRSKTCLSRSLPNASDNPIVGLINSQPDIQCSIEELVCEGNKIAVR
jgi:hypothetical protein